MIYNNINNNNNNNINDPRYGLCRHFSLDDATISKMKGQLPNQSTPGDSKTLLVLRFSAFRWLAACQI